MGKTFYLITVGTSILGNWRRLLFKDETLANGLLLTVYGDTDTRKKESDLDKSRLDAARNNWGQFVSSGDAEPSFADALQAISKRADEIFGEESLKGIGRLSAELNSLLSSMKKDGYTDIATMQEEFKDDILVFLVSDTWSGAAAGLLNAYIAKSVFFRNHRIQWMDNTADTNGTASADSIDFTFNQGNIYILNISDLSTDETGQEREEEQFAKYLGGIMRKISEVIVGEESPFDNCRLLLSGGFKFATGYFKTVFEWLYSRVSATPDTDVDFKIRFCHEDGTLRVYESPYYRFKFSGLSNFENESSTFHDTCYNTEGELTPLGISLREFIK
jgi:hypothetical protein